MRPRHTCTSYCGRSQYITPINLHQWAHTSIRRLTFGFIWVYWVMFPSGIHGLMMQKGNSAFETWMMGRRFGCELSLLSSITRWYIWYKAK